MVWQHEQTKYNALSSVRQSLEDAALAAKANCDVALAEGDEETANLESWKCAYFIGLYKAVNDRVDSLRIVDQEGK